MIRTFKLSDAPRVAEIHVFGWRCAYRGIVSDEILFNDMLVSARIPRFENFASNSGAKSYVYDDGIIKAFMTIGACRDKDKPNSFELWGIYVEPLMKRQGIGTRLIKFCEKKAVDLRYNEICLWVLEKNVDSRCFYEKHGFVADGTSKYLENIKATEVRYVKVMM